ncbi:hypothetical protein GCM10009839_45540 [Catenulispora yoronensis]|uniref:DUF6798 domain-containing protein n=1 Tax=Catenulispora yoronensis TaxID=450799 RepID=A0ABP5G3H4_9ACTN
MKAAEPLVLPGARKPVRLRGPVRHPAPPARPRTRRPARTFLVPAAQAALCAAVLGTLLDLRYGYAAGRMDHFVLSTVGLHWVHPDWFAGDWAMTHAPQPHWFFDVETWFGASLGILAGVYLLHWFASLIVFGLGTVLLARSWAPGYALPVALSVSAMTALTPGLLMGTGSPVLAIALPEMLGGFLVYLFVAAILTGRREIAWVVAPVTAIVHVQQGSIVAVLIGLVLAIDLLRRRAGHSLPPGLLKPAVVSLTVTGVLVIGGLAARPVAGSIGDFADICETLIPYHCAADKWGSHDVHTALASLGLAGLTGFLVPRARRALWFVVFFLPALVLVAGVFAVRWRVPELGLLAQGINVFRLDAFLAAFAPWGLLVPLLRSKGRHPRLLLAVTLVLGYLAVGPATWGSWLIAPHRGGLAMLIGAVALVVGARAVYSGTASQRLLWSCTLLVGAEFVASAASAGLLTARSAGVASPGLRTDVTSDFDRWGRAVEQIVPVGAQLVSPPTDQRIRMATHRGIVVDCKYVPYGGEPWHEFRRRLDALGGIAQCHGDPHGYADLNPDQLWQAARTYGASYAVLAMPKVPVMRRLVAQGWVQVMGPENRIPYVVMRIPGG